MLSIRLKVRVLSNSIMDGEGRLIADKSIKRDPEKSILGLKINDEIRITAEQSARLVTAFGDEFARKYSQGLCKVP